jgi:hypothetical protein
MPVNNILSNQTENGVIFMLRTLFEKILNFKLLPARSGFFENRAIIHSVCVLQGKTMGVDQEKIEGKSMV